MLHAISAPAQRARHPQLKIQEQKLMKNVQVTAKETRNGESLANADTRMTQGLYNILHQAQAAVAVERENGFGMELHTLDRQVAMADPHDDPVVALGGNFKTRWQFLR